MVGAGGFAMKIKEFSHRCGAEVVPEELRSQIINIFSKLDSHVEKGGGTSIRKEVATKLRASGWSDEVRLDSTSKITITGRKDHVGLCIQSGNMSRIYADLMKLQALFLRDSICAGIFILPSHDSAAVIGENIACSERLVRELSIFSSVITAPLWVVGFYE